MVRRMDMKGAARSEMVRRMDMKGAGGVRWSVVWT